MQQCLVDFSSSDAISIAKLDIDTDFQRAAMSHSNYDFQLIVDLTLIAHREGAHAVPISLYSASEGDFSVPANFGNKDYYGAKAPPTLFPKLQKAVFIVASHYSKTFFHFSEDFTIFCEGDQENANNGNNTEDNEVIVWQKSNLP